jgi:serine/threonine-protein kinase
MAAPDDRPDPLRITWGDPHPGRGDPATAATYCTVAANDLDDLTQQLSTVAATLGELGELDEPTVDGPIELVDAPPPMVADRYERRSLLGSGGMGEVWRVHDRLLRRTVALKVIRSQLTGRRMLDRFQEEAQVSAQLQHPGIIPVHDYGQLDDGRVWFTMKEVRGRTLEELLTDVHRAWRLGMSAGESGFTFRRLLEAFLRVCETMAYSHSRGVVHRDLKPSNIMLGGYGEVLVLDWGLAKVMGTGRGGDLPPVDLAGGGASGSTRVGAITGTPAYMSPEQAQGESAAAGPPADVYALGATLYDLLCERPPRLANSPRKLVMMVAVGKPFPSPRAAAAGPPVDEELERICLRALAHDVDDRYPDAGAMAADLAQWLDDARKRERAMAFVEQSQQRMRDAEEAEARAAQKARQAEQALAGVDLTAPVDDKLAGWELEDEAARLTEAGQAARTEGVQLLRAALSHHADLVEAHDALSDYFHAVHRRMEQADRLVEARQAAAELALHDRSGRYAAYLKGTGALTLITSPAGAEARLHRYVEKKRRLEPVFERSLGRTPLVEVPLEMGSYLITLHLEGHEVVRYPVFVERQEHWHGVAPGEREPRVIRLPKVGEVPEGMVYVPAGWFWWGEEPGAGRDPWERRWTEGFEIGTHPVTVGEYSAWLNELWDRGEREEAERRQPVTVDDQKPVLRRTADGRFGTIRNDEPGWEHVSASPQMPVLFCSLPNATAYAKARGAGIPTVEEWLHAGRGADRRSFPWGKHLDVTWLSCRLTPGGPTVFPVGGFPTDCSPYGVRGLAGNVSDWALGDEASYVTGGFCGNYGGGGLRLTFHLVQPPHHQLSYLSFRVIRRQRKLF